MREKLEESEPNWPARNRTKHALYYVTRDLTYSSKAYATTFHNFLKQTSCDQKKKENMYSIWGLTSESGYYYKDLLKSI